LRCRFVDMGHTFPVENAYRLEDAESRYTRLSAEEVVGLLRPSGRVLDVGSGTGFYTDVVAPRADEVYALDVQEEMHRLYKKKGLPSNVETVTADASKAPFKDGFFDRALSTMTYHELDEGATDEIRRVLAGGGVFAVADWSADGTGEGGPPLGERVSLGEATSELCNAGFVVDSASERTETFVVRAHVSPNEIP